MMEIKRKYHDKFVSDFMAGEETLEEDSLSAARSEAEIADTAGDTKECHYCIINCSAGNRDGIE